MSAYEELIKAVNVKAMEFNSHLATVKTANDAIVERSTEILQALSELLGSARPPQVKKCTVCYTREQRVALCTLRTRFLSIVCRPGTALEPLSLVQAAH